MNLNKNIFFALSASSLLFVGCNKKDLTTTPSAGTANFKTYVALGNSITAGYADNALYYDGQMVSYANLLAMQMQMVGGGAFKQPLMPQGSVGVGSSGNARLALSVVNGALAPKPVAPIGDLAALVTSVATSGPFNNMGVPGAQITTAVIPGYGNPGNGGGNYNPFFTRMTSQPATASMLSDAQAVQATFFTVFLGNNDVLGYAASGGEGAALTPINGPAGVGFNASYDAVVEGLMQNGAKGALANLPNVTAAPYFTTVPYNALVLSSQAQVDGLNAAYAQLIGAGTVKTFQLGANGFIIADPTAPGGRRQMVAGELVLLSVPQDSLKNAGWGSIVPIPGQYTLTTIEVGKINTATIAFNAKIKEVADNKGLALVDVNYYLNKVASSGVEVNGRKLTSTFVTGGVFSLDGIHLTPLGNALLANEFIKSINKKYNAFIPQVDPTHYGGVKFP